MSISNTSKPSSSSLEKKRKQNPSHTSDSSKKIQSLVNSNERLFFESYLSEKQELLTRFSTNELYRTLKKEKAASLIEAAQSNHPFFMDCINKLNEKKLSKLCNLIDEKGNCVGISLIQSCPYQFLQHLLGVFATKQVVEKFFFLTNNPTNTNQKKKAQPKGNIFSSLPHIPNNKLSLLVNKLLQTTTANFVATLLFEHKRFRDLNELQELPDAVELLAQEPFSEEKMEVFYLLLKKEIETEKGACSKILPLINMHMLHLSKEEKKLFLKNYLSKIRVILEHSNNKDNLGKEILKLVTFQDDSASTMYFLANRDSHGMTLFEKILILSNDFSEEQECLDLSSIDPNLLINLLSYSSSSSPDHQIIFHFIRAISLGKMNRAMLTVNYFNSNLSKQVLLFFNRNQHLYNCWMKQLYDVSVQSFCCFFLILKIERELNHKQHPETLFSPDLKIFTDAEIFEIVYRFAQPPYISNFSINYRFNIYSLVSDQQFTYIKKRVSLKLTEFIELNPLSPIDNFTSYQGYIFLYTTYCTNSNKLKEIVDSQSFLKLSEDPACSLLICKYFLLPWKDGLAQPDTNEKIKNFIDNSAVNFTSRRQLYDLFLIFFQCNEDPYFIKIEDALLLILTENPSLNILQYQKLQQWLSKDVEVAKKTYATIEQFLINSIDAPPETQNIRKQNASIIFNYIFEKYPDRSIINYFSQDNNYITCFRELVEIALRDHVCIKENLDLSFTLILSRLRFFKKDKMYHILSCFLYDKETFFSKFLLMTSYCPNNEMKKICDHLIKNLSLENFMKLAHLTLAHFDVPDLVEREIIISQILSFILAQPQEIKYLWIRKVFMQQGYSKYKKSVPLLFMPEVSNPTHLYTHYSKKNAALAFKILHAALQLREQESAGPNWRNLKQATQFIINAFIKSRENEEYLISLNKKKDIVLAYNYLVSQTISYLNNAFLVYLKTEQLNPAIFSALFEIYLISDILIASHVRLENYPLLQIPLPPQENANIIDLLNIFKNYTFSDTPSPNNLDLSEMYNEHCSFLRREYDEQLRANVLNLPPLRLPSKEAFKAHLDQLFEKLLKIYIPNRVPITGLSSDNRLRELEYQTIESKLKIITSFLIQQRLKLASINEQEQETAKINLTAFLPILASLATNCATRWIGEIEELLNIIAAQKETLSYCAIPALFKEFNQTHGELSLQENYLAYCKSIKELGSEEELPTKEAYYESLYKNFDNLFLNLIPNHLLDGLSSTDADTNEKQYQKIEDQLIFLTSFISEQMKLLQRDNFEFAKNELGTVFYQLMELTRNNGKDFISRLETLVTSINDNQTEVNPYTKKGKLLKAIQRSYNQRLFGLPHASNVHLMQLYKKIIWREFPFLIENQDTLDYEDPLEPQQTLADGSKADYSFQDVSEHFFGDNSLDKLEENLLMSLHSHDKSELKKQYGNEAITDALIFQIKKSLAEFANKMSFNHPEKEQLINTLAIEFLSLAYDENGDLNEIGLLLLLKQANLLQKNTMF